MGCWTFIKTKKGDILSFGTERYITGTYLAISINGETPNQGTTKKAVSQYYKFHKKIRQDAEKNEDTVIVERSTSLEHCREADKKWEEKNKEYYDK